MTIGLIIWVVWVIILIAVSNSVISDELNGGAVSLIRNWTTAIGLVAITACVLWIWFQRMIVSRQGDNLLHSQIETLVLIIGLTAILAIINVLVSSMASATVVSATVLWFVIPASIGLATISMVLYQTNEAIKYMPFRSVILTFALIAWLGFVSIAVFAIGGVVIGLSSISSDTATVYYSSGIGFGMVIVSLCALWVWLPVITTAGMRPGWLRAHLVTFAVLAVVTASVFLLPMMLTQLISFDILVFIIPILVVLAFASLVCYAKWTQLRSLLQWASATGEIDMEPTPWFDPRAAEWVRAFSANMHTQYYQENRGHNPSTDDWFNEWYGRFHLRKLFLPGDFVSTLKIDSAEDFGCVRIWLDRMFMDIQRGWRFIKVGYIGGYLSDIDYEPSDFRSETVHIATSRTETTCQTCGGEGEVHCPPTESCTWCRGSGRSGCSYCSGFGWYWDLSSDDKDEQRIVSCHHCNGRGYNDCFWCNNGEVDCSLCGGSGRRTCPGCDGAGYMIHAFVTTKTFTHRRDVNFQVEGMGLNRFKNGLKPGHFDKLHGTLVCEENQTPVEPGAIKQKMTASAFYIYSCHYTYNERPFTLSQIYPSKYISTGTPYSKMKITLAVLLATCLIAGVVAFALLL